MGVKLKNIILIGAGAVGTLIANRMVKFPGISFYAAADEKRIRRYRQEGIFFNGEKLPLQFITPAEASAIPTADLIILAVKTIHLPDALKVAAPFTGKNTVFLPFLNGITAPELIADAFPENTVLSGFFLGHASVREKNSIRHDGTGTFFCGGEPSALKAVFQLFTAAKINTELPEDMAHAVWKKFILNVGINQVQAAYHADYGTVQNSPELLKICRQLMLEAISVAEAEGVAHTDKMLSPAMQVILSMPPDVKTSMLQDIQAQRATEVDAFAGTVCAKAAAYGIPTPVNQKILELIKNPTVQR